MTVEIIIRDDQGDVVATHSAPASIPTELRRNAPQGALVDGKYEIWGFTYQPHVRVISGNWSL